MSSNASCAEHLDWAGSAWPVEGLGPGRRVALWVRGCRLACPGCMSRELWDNGTPEPLVDIAAQLDPLLRDADGLTISGGEPLDQAEALLALLRLLRRTRDVEVLCYSGYKLEDLRRRGPTVTILLSELDMLIDGPFMRHLPNTLRWRGSDNQRLHLLSARARERYADVADTSWDGPRPLAIQALDAGQVRLIGIPQRSDLKQYRQSMQQRGFFLGKADEQG